MTSLNLFIGLLTLVAIAQGELSSRLLCPVHCKCTYSSYTQGNAKCTTLDPSLQRFSKDIKQIIVKNAVEPVNVTSSMFVKMGMEHLFVVKIVNSSVSSLDVDAFKGLSELSNVDLSDNKLMLIHPDTFKHNEALRHLSLSGNPLQLTQVLPAVGQYVLSSESLTELDLSNCQLTQLSSNAFSQLKNLDVLILSSNKLTHINPSAFFELSQLVDLDLSYNEITSIPPDTFTNIDALTALSLKGNPLKRFDLPNLSSLKELDLSECDFKNLTAETFEGTPDVVNLNLSRNSIEKINNAAFSALSKLRYLDLSNNKLKSPLSSYLFEYNQNLETLSLSGNKDLKDVPEFVGEFNALYLYDISLCGITELNSKMFHGMHYIATLNISGNNVHKIDLNTFASLTTLNILDLSNNRLTSLDHNVFASNREMTKLYLSGNLLHHISAAMFRPLPKLYILDISRNKLTNLWNKSEVGIMKSEKILGEVTHLNIGYNSLKHLHMSYFASLMKLHVLLLEGNPFVCNQHFIHVIEWLADHRVAPNSGKSSHPVNLPMDDRIVNNRLWASTFDSFCPKEADLDELDPTIPPLQHHTNRIVDMTSLLNELEKSKMNLHPPFERLRASPHPQPFESSHTTPEINYDDLDLSSIQQFTDDANTNRDIILVFKGVAILVAVVFLNVIGFQYWKSRTNYSLVGYKSSFHGGPTLPRGVKIPSRKGQRNAYQKLYEECSVPNPIVRNNKKLSIISVFSNNPNSPIQDV